MALVASAPHFDSLTEEYIIAIKSGTPHEKVEQLKKALEDGGSTNCRVDSQNGNFDRIFATVPINAAYLFFHSPIVEKYDKDPSRHRLVKRNDFELPDGWM